MKRWQIAVVVVVVIAVGVGAFFGGRATGGGSSPSTEGTPAAVGNLPAGAAAGGQGRFGNLAGRNVLTGTIAAVDDSTITVKTSDGSSKIVLYSGSTTMVKTLEATAADLATGQEVVITGSENSDGTVTAQRIQLGVSLPQGAAPGSSTGTSAGGSPGAAGTGGTGAGAATSTTAAQ